MKTDIENIEHIKHMVDTFYGYVQKDELIGPIFNEKIKDNWPAHLNKMHRFWETMLLNVQSYTGSPFPPHAKLDIEKKHFERWFQLFEKTIKENFSGKVADVALIRAASMAQMFQFKLAHIKGETF